MKKQTTILLVGLFVLLGMGSAATAEDEKPKVLKAGIIGLDTSHVIAFTNTLNNPNATGYLALVEVTAGFPNGVKDNPSSWGRVEKYTEQLREKGLTIYDSVDAMLPNVDAVLIECVDGRPHLQYAKKVIAAGKPLFIDKPMAASLADVVEIFRLANEAGVPVFSSSSLRYSTGFQEARNYETSKFGVVKECTAWSPMGTEPHHPDLFWYGVHGVEILFTIMGTGCETVTRESQEKVVGKWKDGRVGIFLGQKGYGAEIVGEKESGNAGTFEGYGALVEKIAEFFHTGKPPIDAEETIELFAFMEAADESKRQGGKPIRIAEILEKAKKASD